MMMDDFFEKEIRNLSIIYGRNIKYWQDFWQNSFKSNTMRSIKTIVEISRTDPVLFGWIDGKYKELDDIIAGLSSGYEIDFLCFLLKCLKDPRLKKDYLEQIIRFSYASDFHEEDLSSMEFASRLIFLLYAKGILMYYDGENTDRIEETLLCMIPFETVYHLSKRSGNDVLSDYEPYFS